MHEAPRTSAGNFPACEVNPALGAVFMEAMYCVNAAVYIFVRGLGTLLNMRKRRRPQDLESGLRGDLFVSVRSLAKAQCCPRREVRASSQPRNLEQIQGNRSWSSAGIAGHDEKCPFAL